MAPMERCPVAPVQVTQPSGKIWKVWKTFKAAVLTTWPFLEFQSADRPVSLLWPSNFPFVFRHFVVSRSLPGKGELIKLKTASFPTPTPNFETLISINSFDYN